MEGECSGAMSCILMLVIKVGWVFGGGFDVAILSSPAPKSVGCMTFFLLIYLSIHFTFQSQPSPACPLPLPCFSERLCVLLIIFLALKNNLNKDMNI